MSKHTPGPWFVSGVRFRMNGGEWHSINRYNESLKRDDNIACVGYDSRTGDGMADARLIAAAPDLLAALKAMTERYTQLAGCGDCGNWNPEEEKIVIETRAMIAKATGETP